MPKVIAQPHPTPSRADDWARTWGEIVTKTDACKMLGLSRPSVIKLVNEGHIKTAPDGRIITRSAADWVENGQKRKKSRRGWRLVI